MALIHEVWAVPPGRSDPVIIDYFDLAGWQFAEKLAQFLRDKGFEDVEVLLEEDYED